MILFIIYYFRQSYCPAKPKFNIYNTRNHLIPVDDEHQGGRFFFRAVKEGDVVLFASEEDIDRQHWVYKLYNATGQSFKPTAPKMDVAAASGGSDTLPRAKGEPL